MAHRKRIAFAVLFFHCVAFTTSPYRIQQGAVLLYYLMGINGINAKLRTWEEHLPFLYKTRGSKRVTQKSFYKESNPRQNTLAGVAGSKSGLSGCPFLDFVPQKFAVTPSRPLAPKVSYPAYS